MALVLIALLALTLLLLATDTALSVWSRLAEAPSWLRYGWIGAVAGVTVLATFAAWRWLRPRPASSETPQAQAMDRDHFDALLTKSLDEGVNAGAAMAELEEQRRRRAGGAIYLAVFGEVSAGKSALVKALLPEADARSDPRAGTTVDIRHYCWAATSGDDVFIADLPGFNLGDDPTLLEEARRAHLVVFLVDSDLTASQHDELSQLQTLDKPLLLALNKSDRYSEAEREAIIDRLTETTGLARRDVVTVRSGGREEVVRILADGSESREERERGVDIEPLRRAIQARLDEDPELMSQLQETAVLLLAAEKLETARAVRQAEQAEELVSRYARRAVVGALAAVAPGSDLVIQGVLATRLLQELCAIYDVSVKDVEIESFLELAGGRVRKMSALTMAIAGNALKAFPGIGTLTGGLLHAVAYGMIFDSLGRAAAQTLASRGDLRALPAAQAFEENLADALEHGAERFARLAVRETQKPDAS